MMSQHKQTMIIYGRITEKLKVNIQEIKIGFLL